MKRRWTDDELLQHFTFHPNELLLLTSTTDHNRLGFAVLLKFFEREGYFPPNSSTIPTQVINHIANQLGVPSKVFSKYNFHGRSIDSHRVRIRQWFGFRPYAEVDRDALILWLCEQALSENQNIEFLVDTVRKHLRKKQIEPPTRASIERLIRSAIQIHQNDLFDAVLKQLTPSMQLALDELQKPIDSSEETDRINIPLHQIRTCRVKASLNSILHAVKQLDQLQQIHLPDDLFASISSKVVNGLRQRAAVEEPYKLRRHPARIRYTLLAA